MQVCSINCPNCGAAIQGDDKTCRYCGSRVFVTSFRDIYAMPIGKLNDYIRGYSKIVQQSDLPVARHSGGLCYLKLGMYDEAYQAFQSAIQNNFNNSEAYFYAAAALFRGKKPFLAVRNTVTQAETLLKAAFAAETRGIYLYFLAYIRYDYYERKCLNVSPNYKEYLLQAKEVGVPEEDITYLFTILNVERPPQL